MFKGTSFEGRVLEREPLAAHTTIGLGGLADYFITVSKKDEVLELLSVARANHCLVEVMGGGSNILVSDSVIRGLVIKLVGGELPEIPAGKEAAFRVDAGIEWDNFVLTTVKAGYTGLECLSGIPGTVGGAAIQNIGAYGQEISNVIESVEAIERSSLKFKKFNKFECGFSYRDSCFKTAWRDKYVVTHVTLRLKKSETNTIKYAELAKKLSIPLGGEASLKDIRSNVLKLRRQKSMVVDPQDKNSHSLGSFFTNPIVEMANLDSILATAKSVGSSKGELPRFSMASGRVKLSAAWLIESSGFIRGYKSGAVGISDNHSLAIVNLGGAKTGDVIELASKIRGAVYDLYGVRLRPEPIFMGFNESADELLS